MRGRLLLEAYHIMEGVGGEILYGGAKDSGGEDGGKQLTWN